ncbi:MAG: hypothetical protein FWD13_12970 [Treponema sp.]|nr:hypothetical protein [Treponema sp.]
MKLQFVRFFIVFTILTSLLFIGCATTYNSPVAYSYAADDFNSATIFFQSGNPGLTFISLEGVTPPRPESGTFWDPFKFPTNRELTLVLYAKYETRARARVEGFGILGDFANFASSVTEMSQNVDGYVTFNCPPLEAGKSYTLAFLKESGIPGRNKLILTDIATRRIIHEQEFGLILGGH